MPSSAHSKHHACPRCGAARVHRSRRRSGFERVLSFFGGAFHRCHQCELRLMRFGPLTLRVNWLESLKRHASLGILLAAATVAILIAILWFGRLRFSGGEALLLPF